MRHLTTIAVFVGGLVLTAGTASAQNWGRPSIPARGACFYEHADFDGRYFCAPVGSATEQVPASINDRISSIRVFGNAEVIVFRNRNFDGQSRTFTSNVKDLRSAGFNDRLSSFRVDSSGFNRRAFGGGDREGKWGRPDVPRTGACFYKNRNFGGDYFCSGVGASVAQVPRGTNDEISSIQLFGNVEVTVFRDSDYRGASRSLDGDLKDLRRSGWDDRISSYRITPIRLGRDRAGSADRRGSLDRSDGRWTHQQAEAIVSRAYQEVFNREADAGAQGWVDTVMKNNWTQQQLVTELKKSDEYRNSQRPSRR